MRVYGGGREAEAVGGAGYAHLPMEKIWFARGAFCVLVLGPRLTTVACAGGTARAGETIAFTGV